MSINVRAAGFAGAFTAAVLWVICSLMLAVAPGGTAAAGRAMFHLGMVTMTWTVSWGSFVLGLVLWSVLTGLICAGYAALYNRRVS